VLGDAELSVTGALYHLTLFSDTPYMYMYGFTLVYIYIYIYIYIGGWGDKLLQQPPNREIVFVFVSFVRALGRAGGRKIRVGVSR